MKKYITAAALIAAGTAFANAASVTLSTDLQESATATTSIASFGFSASLTSDWLSGWDDSYTGLQLSEVSFSVSTTNTTSYWLTIVELDSMPSSAVSADALTYVGLSSSSVQISGGSLTFSFDGVTLSADKEYAFLLLTGTNPSINSSQTITGGSFAYLDMVAYGNTDCGTTSTNEGFIQRANNVYTLNAQSNNKANVSITGTAIPEPSAFGLLAGVSALALAASRRRRAK